MIGPSLAMSTRECGYEPSMTLQLMEQVLMETILMEVSAWLWPCLFSFFEDSLTTFILLSLKEKRD